jgi:NADPH:quinone reductase-like Zn-dependent oxidoreductase/SAM-dependent methyltransferase/NAD(P)-dependent dehydrogenase (short-subunit alcohol dehydrogenase family)/acyl carrier protein
MLDRRSLGYLNDHRLDGRTVLPASASVEMAIAAAGQLSAAQRFTLEDIHFSKVCILPEAEARTIQTVLNPDEATFTVYSKTAGSDTAWNAHVRGRVRGRDNDGASQTPLDLEEIRSRCTRALSGADLYRNFAAAGMEYGPAFQGVHRIWRGKEEALAQIQRPEGIEDENYQLHPAQLDACFHAAAGLATAAAAYLPVEIRQIRVHKPLATARWSYAVLKELTAGKLVADVRVLDAAGNPLVDVEGLRCRAVETEMNADRNLNRLVYEFKWLPQVLPGPVLRPDPAVIAHKTNTGAGGYGNELELISRYERLEPEIDRVCSAFIVKAFRNLGGQLQPGRRFSTEQFAALIGIAKRYRDLLNRYLQILQADGCLLWRGSEWEVVERPAFEDPEPAWRDLIARNPAFFGELTLLGRCGSRLAPILRGELDPLQVIFPNGSMALAEHLYQSSPSLRFYNTLVRRAVAAAVEALPAGFPVRLLEVGAGTGGLTANVLPALQPESSTYIFTDVSAHFFAKAQEKFRKYGFVDYRRLDIETEPVAQGFQANSFDIILASEALHATADLRRTLDNVRQLLAPGGLLILLEAVKPTRWIDLVFGLTEGWWRFTDRDLRPAYPLLPLDRWRTLLEETGFTNITEASGRPQHHVENAVIMGAAPTVPAAPKGDVGAAPMSPFVVLTDAGGVGQRVAAALRARGVPHTTDPETILNGAGGVLHFRNLDSEDATASRQHCQSVVDLVRALGRNKQSTSPRLWIVTRNAQHIHNSDPAPSVFQAPVWGLARVAGNEAAEFRPTLVDLSAAATDDEIQRFVDEILADAPETEIALRGNVRYVHRYVRASEVQTRTIRMDEAPFSLDASTPALGERGRLGPGLIELRVIAAALDSGKPTPWHGCAGRVTRAGAGVEHLQDGDEVVAVALQNAANLVVTPACYAVRKPSRLSFAEAATIPSAFLTAAYALRHIGRLAAGERILVQCAAGDVALAAIQLARKAGGVVLATADTAEMRDFLHDAGVEYVLDSTSLAWPDEVMAATHGRGVDVILHSHSAETLPHADVLSEYGRFLHVAAPAGSNGGRMPPAALRRNQAFFNIDFDSVWREREEILTALFLELMREISEGTLQPLPHRVFPVSDASTAFQNAVRADQTGKVVIGFEEQEIAVSVPPKSAPLLRADATYLISGGLGGFGLKVAHWMVEGGARHIVLMGRHADEDPQAHQSVLELRRQGAEVIAAKADVARTEDVAQLIASIDQSMPPLRGVVHAAMVLQDCRLMDLDEARMEAVCAPKINGAWNLHAATTNRTLDFFVLFSSMSSVFGIPGQASYAAANAFLHSFAHYRRALGLPALTVDWGYLGEAGWVARQPAVQARLETQGIRSFSPIEALTVLERLLRRESVAAGVIRIAWPQWAKSIGAASIPPRFASLTREEALHEANTLNTGLRLDRKTLLATPPEGRRAKIEEYVREQVGQVLGLSPAKVDIQQPVGQLGLDSLMAVELRNRVEKDLSITLPAVTLLEQPSVASLAAELQARLEGPAVPLPEERQTEAGSLSSSQRWLWRLHETARSYSWRHFIMSIRIRGSLNMTALERSIDAIVRRHAVLRTRIVRIDDRPSAVAVAHEELKFVLIDRSNLTESQREAQIRAVATEESTKPFDFAQGRLIRAVLLRFAAEDHALLVTAHPLAFDDSSMEIFLRELELLYPAFAGGKPSPLAALPIQYADFAIQEQQWLDSEPFERQLTYWKKMLASPPPMLEFPTDRARAENQLYQPASASTDVAAELSRSIRGLAYDEGATLQIVVLAAFQTLLYRYTNQAGFAIGCYTSARSHPELRDLIGPFVNYLVFRVDTSGDPSFRQLLKRVREAVLEIQNNQDVPFDVLLDALQIKPALSHTPLFQVALAFDLVAFSLEGRAVIDRPIQHFTGVGNNCGGP